MLKWYEEQGSNDDIVISSRVRLARNLSNYPFSKKISEEQAKKLVSEVGECLQEYKDDDGKYFSCTLASFSEMERLSMVERHLVSSELANKKQETGLVMSENESTSIMINEEDHLRIQSLVGGMNLERAYQKANAIDDYAGEELGFAFDEKYGYLTSCPTNVGTGLRASYMVFLPALGGANKINRLSDEV